MLYVAGLIQAGSFLPRIVVLYQGSSDWLHLCSIIVCTMLFSQGLLLGGQSWDLA